MFHGKHPKLASQTVLALYLLTERFEGKSAREIICKLPRAANSQQIKNPPCGNRVIRLQIIRGDGSKTGVGVYRDARGSSPRRRSGRNGGGGGQSRGDRGRRQEGEEECCWRRCLAVARTRARSVVMSAGGQAADYYHCMNMNETRRTRTRTRTRRRTRRWRMRRTENGGGGRTSAEKDVRIRVRSGSTENVA